MQTRSPHRDRQNRAVWHQPEATVRATPRVGVSLRPTLVRSRIRQTPDPMEPAGRKPVQKARSQQPRGMRLHNQSSGIRRPTSVSRDPSCRRRDRQRRPFPTPQCFRSGPSPTPVDRAHNRCCPGGDYRSSASCAVAHPQTHPNSRGPAPVPLIGSNKRNGNGTAGTQSTPGLRRPGSARTAGRLRVRRPIRGGCAPGRGRRRSGCPPAYPTPSVRVAN
ncbi:hypothetical protein ABID74_002077 [Gordonia terrae]